MNIEPGMIFAFAGSMAILFAITKVALAWLRRSRLPRYGPVDLEARLDRLEHLMESTALEVERIGEGQRFLTNRLAAAPLSPVAERLPSPLTTPH